MQKTWRRPAPFVVCRFVFDSIALIPRGKCNSGPFNPCDVFIDVSDKIWNYFIPSARGQYIWPPPQTSVHSQSSQTQSNR